MKMHEAGNKYNFNKQNKANNKHSLCLVYVKIWIITTLTI